MLHHCPQLITITAFRNYHSFFGLVYGCSKQRPFHLLKRFLTTRGLLISCAVTVCPRIWWCHYNLAPLCQVFLMGGSVEFVNRQNTKRGLIKDGRNVRKWFSMTHILHNQSQTFVGRHVAALDAWDLLF